MRAIVALSLFLLEGAHGQYQQYMNQYAGQYQQYMGGSHGQSPGQQGGTATNQPGGQYMNQYAGQYQQYMGGSHGQSPDQQGGTAPKQPGGEYYQQYMTGGHQGQQGGVAYQNFMKLPASGQQGQQGGFDYQKYTKQYASGQQGQQGGFDYQKYMKQYASGQQGQQGGNHTSDNQKYMDQYAGPYEKYMHTNGSDYKHKYADQYAGMHTNGSDYKHKSADQYAGHHEKVAEAPMHAEDCKTGPELCAWLSGQVAVIDTNIPAADQAGSLSTVGKTFKAQLARVAAANNQTVHDIKCSHELTDFTHDKAVKLAEQPAKTMEQPAEMGAVQRAAAETQQKPSSLDSEFLSQKRVGELAQSQLSASSSPRGGMGYLSVACFACGTLLLLAVVRLRAARRATSEEHSVTEYQALA